MNNAFGTSGRNSRRPFADAFDNAGQGLWDSFDKMRSDLERRVAPRMGRGDVRVAILHLLAEESMHGYQIIHEIEKRSNGAWKPSPGSVYPTLQLLADEGLIEAHEAEGKRLTPSPKKGMRKLNLTVPPHGKILLHVTPHVPPHSPAQPQNSPKLWCRSCATVTLSNLTRPSASSMMRGVSCTQSSPRTERMSRPVGTREN
ncbi:Transcriptional regulator, PadR family [Leifsonia rubra CMS 76R]|nr:Transcriptional regulator, PadR family [Leifsonia rubra CMS 76R]